MRGCNGWSYHVFTLGADRCSVCRKTLAQIKAELPAPVREEEESGDE